MKHNKWKGTLIDSTVICLWRFPGTLASQGLRWPHQTPMSVFHHVTHFDKACSQAKSRLWRWLI